MPCFFSAGSNFCQADLLDVVDGRKEGNLYTRYGLNPTIRSLERKLADLENGEAALAFSSGMAAEAATFLAHLKTGDHVICIGDVYGGTYELLGSNLPGLGITTTTFLLASEAGNLASALTDRTKMVFFETPTNPGLDVIDIGAVARAVNIPIMVQHATIPLSVDQVVALSREFDNVRYVKEEALNVSGHLITEILARAEGRLEDDGTLRVTAVAVGPLDNNVYLPLAASRTRFGEILIRRTAGS